MSRSYTRYSCPSVTTVHCHLCTRALPPVYCVPGTLHADVSADSFRTRDVSGPVQGLVPSSRDTPVDSVQFLVVPWWWGAECPRVPCHGPPLRTRTGTLRCPSGPPRPSPDPRTPTEAHSPTSAVHKGRGTLGRSTHACTSTVRHLVHVRAPVCHL